MTPPYYPSHAACSPLAQPRGTTLYVLLGTKHPNELPSLCIIIDNMLVLHHALLEWLLTGSTPDLSQPNYLNPDVVPLGSILTTEDATVSSAAATLLPKSRTWQPECHMASTPHFPPPERDNPPSPRNSPDDPQPIPPKPRPAPTESIHKPLHTLTVGDNQVSSVTRPLTGESLSPVLTGRERTARNALAKRRETVRPKKNTRNGQLTIKSFWQVTLASLQPHSHQTASHLGQPLQPRMETCRPA
jgi:hypothetical protein